MSVLTLFMVVVGSSLMVALNGLSAGFESFIDKSFSMLAPNVLFISSVQHDQYSSGPFGGAGPTPPAKITLNSAVESSIRSLPHVQDVIPTYQGQIRLDSAGKILGKSVFLSIPQSYMSLHRR